MKNMGAKSREIDLVGFDESIEASVSFATMSGSNDESSIGAVVVELMIDGDVGFFVTTLVRGAVGDVLKE